MFRGTDNRRREFLKLAAFSLAGLTAPSARAMYQPQREAIQRPETPERALSLLGEGNQRFLAQKFISFNEDLDILKAHSEEHQEPFAAVLSCADSRVPVELVFDQSIGHLLEFGAIGVPGQISTLYQYIHPAIAGANGDLTTASRQNAMLQASVLRDTSPVLGDLVKQKKLAIRAAMYDVGSGKVTML